MSKIRKSGNRLFIEQDKNVICINHMPDGSLEIEEHCVLQESEESASFFILNPKETRALFEHLFACEVQEAIRLQPPSEESFEHFPVPAVSIGERHAHRHSSTKKVPVQ